MRPLCVFRPERPLHAVVPATLRQPPVSTPEAATSPYDIDLPGRRATALIDALSFRKLPRKDHVKSVESSIGFLQSCGGLGTTTVTLRGGLGGSCLAVSVEEGTVISSRRRRCAGRHSSRSHDPRHRSVHSNLETATTHRDSPLVPSFRVWKHQTLPGKGKASCRCLSFSPVLIMLSQCWFAVDQPHGLQQIQAGRE